VTFTPDEAATAGTSTGTLAKNGDVLSFNGDWLLENFQTLPGALASPTQKPTALDFSHLGELDTAGAARICQVVGKESLLELLPAATGLSGERRALLERVAESIYADHERVTPTRGWLDQVEQLGIAVHQGYRYFIGVLGFFGQVLVTFLALLPRVKRWRITSLVHHIQQTGLNAVPIVALLTFMVGAVVAFLGATVLANFGATIYTVDLVAYSFFREFGVLLTAILLAGRTASAFTAQLGAMKVNEEIDALRTLGMDPIEVLVLPRMLALLIIFPLLTFIAILSGVAGGAVVSVYALDISLTRYIGIVHEVEIRHFLVGMSKAPVFAVVIALIGCLEGFKVRNTAESVGEHTTSSVVQAIFFVILLDAIAAMFYMEMSW